MGKEIEDLKKRIEIFKKIKIIETSGEVEEHENPIAFGHFRIIIKDAYNLFPKEKPILDNLSSIYLFHGKPYTYLKNLNQFLDYISSLIEEYESSEKQPIENEKKVFLDAKERIQKATKAFKQEDYAACISHIHSSIEKALKKKLKIPPTIINIKIGPLIGFCIRNKVFPEMNMFLKEIDKKAATIDNAFKHKSYEPQKPEALEALSLGQEFVVEIEHSKPALPKNFHEELSKSIKFLDMGK